MTKATNYKFAKFLMIFITMAILSCQQSEEILLIEEQSSNQNNAAGFDFDNFGITHNAYLDYVRQIDNADDPKARFNHGKTFVSPIFGSFDIGLNWEQMSSFFPTHEARIESIANGTYSAAAEGLSPDMTTFLDRLAVISKNALDQGSSIGEFQSKISDLETQVKRNHVIQIDLNSGISNDGATMLAICSILRYSLDYWNSEDSYQKAARPGFFQRVKRALADAWGYVSDWQPNGDGSYSWSHGSALVNADCVSDGVYEN